MTDVDTLGSWAANLAATAVLDRSGLYLALHNAQPTLGPSSEMAGGGYVRQPISFTIGSRGGVNSNLQTFSSLPAGTVNFLAVWSAISSGFLVFAVDISDDPLIVPSGGVVKVPPGDLSLSW